MTKMHFIRAAEIVRAIHHGEWTLVFPQWADDRRNMLAFQGCDTAYTRAVHTAEAFLHLFREFNPRFDEQRFLQACGLAEAPTKTSKPRRDQ